MFSGIPQKNRAGAESYFDEHLSQNDYYTQGETQRGHWLGMGAEQLGLKPGGIVTRDSFLKLCDNQHPTTGEQLTPQHFKERRIYFDFVCSPPKSVSILAITMNDQRIIEAHKAASQLAMRELESFAAARVRKGGIQEQDRVTGNLVGAAFLHTTSRALDPQLHTHFVLFNATWDKSEQRWKALQTGDMFGAINYGTAVYRNELAKRLHQIGYSTKRVGAAFEIDGVDPKFIERFSKRSQQRDVAVKRQETKLGRKLTKKEVAHVVHQSRPKKIKGASDDEVRHQQLGEIGFFEKRNLRKVVAIADGQPKRFAEKVVADDALTHSLGHIFERRSVAPQHKILGTALVHGCGQLDLPRLKLELNVWPGLVQVGSEFSTRRILLNELYLIRTVNAGIGAVVPFVHPCEPSAHLGPDQQKALAHVLTSPDRITGFRGLAGSGKSTLLKELARTFYRAGFESVFCAPTASAADTLRKEGLEATTLARLHTDLSVRGRLGPRSVIILDEAGAVGLDDMVNLFDLARRSDCRIVLSGDTGQHASVARGDALRIIEQYSSYRFSELTTIRRQKPAEFRQVVELAAAKQTDKAFAKLVELGAVNELSNESGQLYQRAADAYVSATKRGRSALLVSPTWAEIDAVTEKVRETLKADGVVSQDEQTFHVFDSLSWTEAQKKNNRQFEPGQRLRFVRQTKKFDRGETVEVVAKVETGLRIRRADGTETDFIPASAAASFDVGESRELKVAAGDWLLLQANHGRDFINGERVQVRAIQNSGIALTDGRTLPANFNTFTHGYAVTSHSSQGKTVDEVLLVASSKSFPAVNREQFYVSISRGRERVQIFTDDSELLARRVTDTHERTAAVELVALHQELTKLGYTPKQKLEKLAAPPEVAIGENDFRTVRPMRDLMPRLHRLTRLSPVQQVMQLVEDARRWLGLGQTEMVASEPAMKVQATETVKEVENISPAKAETTKIEPEKIRPEPKWKNRIAIKPTEPPPRQSRGVRM
jgi:conjugative relaxase-like TrwC/TraI family protein